VPQPPCGTLVWEIRHVRSMNREVNQIRQCHRAGHRLLVISLCCLLLLSICLAWPTGEVLWANTFLSTSGSREDTPGGGTAPPVPEQPTTSTLALFHGNLHAHSSYADGEGTPAEAFTYARDVAELDFFALTDHAELLSPGEWADTCAQARAATQDGRFVALTGFEWTDYLVGHSCVFGTSDYTSFFDPQSNTLEKFYTWLEDRPEAIGQFNHPKPSNFLSFAYREGAAQQMALLETGNVEKRYEQGFLAALDHGWRVGAVAAQDNHQADWGTASGHMTGIWAQSLTSSALLEALRARRTFGSEDSDLLLSLHLNETWMGSSIQGWTNQALRFRLQVDDPGLGEIVARADLLTNGGFVLATTTGSSNRLERRLNLNNAGGSRWFLARVQEADGDLAYSSPIWVDEAGPPSLLVTPDSLTFTATWGADPDRQKVILAGSPAGNLEWEVGCDQSWITLLPSDGWTSGGTSTILVGINSEGLGPGTFSATLTVTSPGAINSPQRIPIRLELKPPPLFTFDLLLHPGWNQISLPEWTSSSPAEVFARLPGPFSLYAWDPLSGTYRGATQVVLQPGAGYWFRCPTLTTPYLYPIEGVPFAPPLLSLDLTPGWNMIGSPYLQMLPWDSCGIRDRGTLLSWDQAVQKGMISDRYYCFDGISYQNPGSGLMPGLGIWLKAFQFCQLLLRQP
jgi:hypothetical protein